MKVLISAFDAFGGEEINPSYEVLKLIPDVIDHKEIIKLQIPTEFKKAPEVFINKLIDCKPDYAISLGQAGGRSSISIERVSINIDDASIADNSGYMPSDEVIDLNGENAYFSTLPIKKIAENIKAAGIPVSISNTAGTFVCNHIMYSVLNYIHKNKLNIKYGFIHIPYVHNQVVNKVNTPSMSLETMTLAIAKAISSLK